MTYFVGIDNGLSGGIVVITEKNEIVYKFIMPTIKVGTRREYDITEINETLSKIVDLGKYGTVFVGLERAQVFPVSGKRACFMTGYGYGIIKALLGANELSYEVIQPKAWQKETILGLDEDTKKASAKFCEKTFYGIDWRVGKCKKAHDGMTDAACIAVYLKKKVMNDETTIKAC